MQWVEQQPIIERITEYFESLKEHEVVETPA